MELPEEILKKGRITIYNDTPFEVVQAANEYNEHLQKCRKKAKFVEEIEFGYLVMNLILGLCLGALFAETALEMPFVSIPIMLLNVFAYIFFGVIKRNLLVCTVCTTLFVFVSILYFILVTADFVLFFMHRHITEELKKEPGYPVFAEFQVHYARGAAPDKESENTAFDRNDDETVGDGTI